MNWCESVLIEDHANHWGFPTGSLTSGRISHILMHSNMAVWTSHGGVVAFPDCTLGNAIVETIRQHIDDEPCNTLCALDEVVKAVQPNASCSLDVGFYIETPPCKASATSRQVEMLRQQDVWPGEADVLPVEHIFGVRTEDMVISRAFSRHSLTVDGRRFYAIGVGTHPDYQGKGLATAVVSALVEAVVSEGGIALWNCEATNIASLKLARSVGFVEYLWVLNWKLQ